METSKIISYLEKHVSKVAKVTMVILEAMLLEGWNV